MCCNEQEIIQLINRFSLIVDKRDDSSLNKLLTMFVDECEMDYDVFGQATDKASLEIILKEQLSLEFLGAVRHISQSHVVDIEKDGLKATSSSYILGYWKCAPIYVAEWEDELMKVNGKWHFSKRKLVQLQKNLELIGDMQLRGKKQYANSEKKASSSTQ